MWGHYAKNHTGVCLGIEVPDGRAMQVRYEPARLTHLLDLSPLEAAVDVDLINKVVTTKFKEWEYEREWRYVSPLENRDKETGLFYMYFSPEFELREIIAGARCQRSLEDIRAQVFANTDEIKLTKVRTAFGTFSMVQQKMQRALTISPLHQVAGLGSKARKK